MKSASVVVVNSNKYMGEVVKPNRYLERIYFVPKRMNVGRF